jgi:hypothetical protein
LYGLARQQRAFGGGAIQLEGATAFGHVDRGGLHLVDK